MGGCSEKQFTRSPKWRKGKSVLPAALRVIQRWHVKQVMDNAGVPYGSYHGWKNGEYGPTLQTLEAVLFATGHQLKVERIPD